MTEFHHGDCKGADAVANYTVNRFYSTKAIIHIHPPNAKRYRAYCYHGGSQVLHKQKPYIERNHDIVDQTDVLIAISNTEVEVQRSGTWATVRYARKKGKLIFIIFPNGHTKVEPHPNAK